MTRTLFAALAKVLEVDVPWHREFPISNVIENPTREQLKKVTRDGDCRGYLVKDGLIVWFPFDALHSDVRKSLNLNDSSIPVYLYVHNGTIYGVSVTDDSKSSKWYHNQKVKEAILDNKFIKRFGHHTIDVNYFDEDIVGPWDKLQE